MTLTKKSIPITEQANELTMELDMAEPIGIARLFRQGDAQLFSGYKTHPGLVDQEILANATTIVKKAAAAIKAGKSGVILLSGAGTSGRFSHLLARQFNRFLNQAGLPEVFKPLVAGGVLALVKAQEGAEDDPLQGRVDMENRIPEKPTDILYVGITCGLSAPYIAGQMDALRANEAATTVLMGFNPTDTIRDVEIEGWDQTFRETVEKFGEEDSFILLNPVYGPESIMGSTRLKGGTATKLLLEAIFFTALEITDIVTQAKGSLSGKDANNDTAIKNRLLTLIRMYDQTIQQTYDHLDTIAELIRLGGSTLRSGGQIDYLGRESAGIMGLIDASECPPTFGASFDDIRCFLRGGWPELMDAEGIDHSGAGPEFKIDLDSFEKDKLPDLAKGDLVLGLAIGELGPNVRLLLEEAKATKATVALLMITVSADLPADLPVEKENIFHIQLSSLGFVSGYHNLAEQSLKVALNALSSGAHIMIGKIFNNRMIDLKISNNKLYFRAIRTISVLANVEENVAQQSLHRAVYQKDSLSDEEAKAAPSTIIQAAIDGNRIVPTALLLAISGMTHDQAKKRLASDPVPRRVINDVLENES